MSIFIFFQPSTEADEMHARDKKKDKDKKNRNGESGGEKKTREDGEWSEDELERKRRLLLEQLASSEQSEDHHQ